MDIIGHRGFKRRYPENTMASFKAAADYPIQGIECDVQWTKDHVPVIIHDPTLERTTNGSGSVAEHSWSDLQKLDAGSYFDSRYSSEKIPSLKHLVHWISKTDLTFHLELKEQMNISDAAFIESCIEVLKEGSMVERTVISTFYHRYIREVKRQSPKIETALLTKTPFRRGKNYAEKVAADSIHIRHSVQSSLYYKPWKKQRIKVRAYNVKNAQAFLRCRNAGVNGVITDDPALMTELNI
ncbi:glycerophosphodiester phosphodiesterase [Alkalicoccus halolimnae]|uniref:Glycerophosphodiester phosphodiesterase family protein n=1 Tax=Alkalicoccus halolimnae TaxID=1667239 RepID=A0A5C7FJX1_9BACI|nr:glycerophosphodiester phosphodiesterase family protein [Alkalicoccus halolimnae]TXF86429.1 glycerophosphodiester phosphodiesterase [Alkalicoccus halolimnae]